jgi:ribonuclease P protein component
VHYGGKSVLPDSGLLKRPGDYQLVYRKGTRLRGDRFSIIYCANGLAENRLGISIHGIKKAVRRNRIKRIIREFYRLNRQFITTPSDIIFAVRKGFFLDSPQEIKKAVDQLLHRQSGIRR